MANPLGAILSGIGAGATSAGDSLTQEALLAAQMKRQSALDAIARQQKLNELGLTPTDSTDPTQPQNLSAVQQVAMQAQSPQDVVKAGQSMKPTDYALKQLVRLPTATGGTQTYTQGKPMAEQLADERQSAQEDRQEKFLAAQEAARAAREAANAVDPAVLQKALTGDKASQAQVLVKMPRFQTTFNALQKPGPVPRNIDPLSPEGITAEAKKAGAVKAAEVAAAGPKPPSAAQQALQDQLAGVLGPLQSADASLDKMSVPGAVQRGLSHVPGQPFVSDNTQLQQTSGRDWTTNYMQTLKTRGMPLPTLDYMNQTYIPQPGDKPAVVALKSQNRKAAAAAIAARAQGQRPSVNTNNAFGDLVPKKPDDE